MDTYRSNRVNMNTSIPHKVALVAFENISAFHLSVPCLVFQDAFVRQTPRFELEICSLTGPAISTGSGFDVVFAQSLELLDNADIVIIPSWPDTLPTPPKVLLDKLNAAHQRGATVVGLCLGAFVLAESGLLNGYTATTHWAFADEFATRFPDVNVDSEPLFVDQGQVITSAGIAASIDCCLHIVRRFCGSGVANNIARVMVTAPFRSGGQKQYIPSPVASKPEQVTSLTQIIDQISQTINQPHNLDSVAEKCAMSRRTFTRRFKAAYGCTFTQWLLNQRLKLSQQLLESSHYSITQISELAGFGSESMYRKNFKTAFDVSPSEWRARFQGAENKHP